MVVLTVTEFCRLEGEIKAFFSLINCHCSVGGVSTGLDRNPYEESSWDQDQSKVLLHSQDDKNHTWSTLICQVKPTRHSRIWILKRQTPWRTAGFTNLPSVLSELSSLPLQLADCSELDLTITDAAATVPQRRPSTASSLIKQTGGWLVCYLQTYLLMDTQAALKGCPSGRIQSSPYCVKYLSKFDQQSFWHFLNINLNLLYLWNM